MQKADEMKIAEFQENLRRLDEQFPDVQVLNNKQTYGFLGIADKTLKKHFGKYRNNKLGGYPKTTIAKMMILEG